jgi:small subunit ribosomal protein S7
MPRRARVVHRPVVPDAKFHNASITKFINKIMISGKKATAEGIMYDALTIVENQSRRNPIETFDQALRNATPMLEVKPRRVGGATYQVPVEIRSERRAALAIRWLIEAARKRAGRSMAEKLAGELLDAAHGTGTTIKKREDTHRMAEANKAFAHYKW